MFYITDELRIPFNELNFSYVRSSGPGGQKVNKKNTKAVLKWSVTDTHHLSEDVKHRILHQLKRQISEEGNLVITSDRFRQRERNIADCLEKLRSKVIHALHIPNRRAKTKKSRAAIEKRLESKRKRSETKRMRQAVEKPE